MKANIFKKIILLGTISYIGVLGSAAWAEPYLSLHYDNDLLDKGVTGFEVHYEKGRIDKEPVHKSHDSHLLASGHLALLPGGVITEVNLIGKHVTKCTLPNELKMKEIKKEDNLNLIYDISLYNGELTCKVTVHK